MTEQKQTQIQSIEQRVVLFYDDELIAIRGNDSNVYVSIRHLCNALDLNRRGQVQRIQRNRVLERGYRLGHVETDGGRQLAGLLRVDLLPLWLAGLSTKSVRSEMQSQLERYQDEAAKVLWEAFQEGRLTAEPTFTDLLKSDSPAAQAYRVAEAMMKLARNQLMLESRLDDHDARFGKHEQRIETIESTLFDTNRHITEMQASQISQSVKAVAMALSKKSGRNEYGGVYGNCTASLVLQVISCCHPISFKRQWIGLQSDTLNLLEKSLFSRLIFVSDFTLGIVEVKCANL